MKKIPIAKEGYPFIVPALGLTALFAYLNFYCLTSISGLLAAFVIYFFRDPERKIPEQEDILVSPADGKVIGIDHNAKTKEGEEGILINIFLNVFNVHVNRAPCAGKITQTIYNPGKFLPAYREKASELNEQNKIIIENDKGHKIYVTQIAGLIAKRIVCWVKPGDAILRGDRFGLIRFGSRVDMFVPKSTSIDVKVGDKVKGGESILGKA